MKVLKPETKINIDKNAPLSYTLFPLNDETAYIITEADAEVMKKNQYVQFLDGKIQPYDYTPPKPEISLENQLKKIEKKLLEILDQEQLDKACGIIKIDPMSLEFTEKDELIEERKRLLDLIQEV